MIVKIIFLFRKEIQNKLNTPPVYVLLIIYLRNKNTQIHAYFNYVQNQEREKNSLFFILIKIII